MKSKVWVFPGAIHPELESIWEEPPAGLRFLAELGEVFRLLPSTASIESALMGLGEEVEVPRGPLVVSAFGWEPPSKSVHFELTLLSVDPGGKIKFCDPLSSEDAEAISREIGRLGTRKLTPKWGEQMTHGLVWEEGSIDLFCRCPNEVIDQSYGFGLPEGDGEQMLRTFIDDSLNLLDGLEVNKRRFDEGKAKANFLWPHSFGFEPDLPNLALRRGSVATYWSSEIGLEGMARLVGYRHFDRNRFRRGIHVTEVALTEHKVYDGPGVLCDQQITTALKNGRAEEAHFGLEEFDRVVWEPLATSLQSEGIDASAILCPGVDGQPGMGLVFGGKAQSNHIPFDMRAWDDHRLRNLRMNEVMAKILGG